MRRTTVRYANIAQSISGSHYGQHDAQDGAGIRTPDGRPCRMYREESVKHTLGQICMYRSRRVSVCGKNVISENHLLVLLPLCFWPANFL